jgi:DNA-binding NarL/FixJ family response regulator
VRLADLRIRQGRLEEAEQLLEDLDIGVESARPLAAVRLAQGKLELAVDTVERALAELDPGSIAAAPLWSVLVDAHLAAGSIEEAALAADMLDICANRQNGPYVRATAALARGRLCLALADGDPCAHLREALAGFHRARTPMEIAETRLELANALVAERPEVARSEARAALEGFERLPAARRADAAAALLRALGARERPAQRDEGSLTKREAEVLELLGFGLSNREIGDRLFISRKTVEHHVGRILSKLSLRGRAEAAAYAARTKPATR